jgi:hypothetical protein
MKPTKEQIEAYKEMAKTSPDSMRAMIEANLKATCDKYAGHEDRLDDCIDYLTECAKEILDHKNGEVDNETCYRICRDYFNDELWNVEEVKTKAEAAKIESKIQQAKFKKEKAAQAVKDAKAQMANAKKEVKKAEKESSEFHRKEERKYMEAMAKKVTQDFENEQLDKERERLEKLKEKHGLKAAEPPKKEPEAKKFPTCRVCGREVINVYKDGMCVECYYKRPMQAEKTPAQTAQIQPEQGQLDLFAAMGV